MAVFNFGDPANRRPPWRAAPMPRRHGPGVGVGTGAGPVTQVAASPVDAIGAVCAPRVLVVDDNPLNRMLASEMLALWGIAPLLAADGSEAVAIAREGRLELILMDLQMPVLDGLEATRQIRRFELERDRPRVPIVAYTSAALGTDPLHLKRHGLDGALAKPCEAHELHACLLRWCAQTKVAAPAADRADGERDRPRSARAGSTP